VWDALCRIPVSETITYAELARQLGSGARAVANACGANPLPIVIPCHRVVAKSGLGGFMRGNEVASLEIKRWLLNHERSTSSPA
jgi:methylated-DNA-[protein]-cysteine S-methyltransferase